MYQGFIFDLDGVITDTAELHYVAWLALAEQQGWEFNREINDQLRGRSRDACIRILAPTTLSDAEYDRLAQMKNDIYVASLQHLSSQDILPNVEAFLRKIKQQGARLAVASASKNARTILAKLGIDHYFDSISDGDSVVNSKPSPDVFIHACGSIQLRVDQCVVLEDASSGIQGAKQAGFKTIGIGEHLRLDQPTWLINSTHGLLELEF